MNNTAKCFLILEELKFGIIEDCANNEQQRLEQNVLILQKYLKLQCKESLKQNAENLDIPFEKFECSELPLVFTYSIYLQNVILIIIKNTNFESENKEDLISSKHINLCIEAIQELAIYLLTHCLHAKFYETDIYKVWHKLQINAQYEYLSFNIEFFALVLRIPQFNLANSMEMVHRDYMAAIFSCLCAGELQQVQWEFNQLKNFKQKLQDLWLFNSKVHYFRNIMLFKAMPQLPKPLQRILHCELMQKLASTDGFVSLVATLQIAQQQNKTNEKQSNDIVAQIVAFKGHSAKFQQQMIEQIWKFFQMCLQNTAMAENMGVGLLCLRRLYDLSSENANNIEQKLQNSMQPLIKPADILTGLIVCEHQQFCAIISQLYHLFCTSSLECLPSKLLIKYLPCLFQLYYNIPEQLNQKQQLVALLLQCLNNRTNLELTSIIQKLYKQQFDNNFQQMHERLYIKANEALSEICLQIVNAEHKIDFNISLAMPELLINAEYHQLSYNIFITLLTLISDELFNESPTTKNLDFIQTEQEFTEFLNSEYPYKLEILLSLNSLIAHSKLKAQIAENAAEFLKFLLQILKKRISQHQSVHNNEACDHTLLILLTLTEEMLINHQLQIQNTEEFLSMLQKLQSQSSNELILQRIKCLFSLLLGETQHKTENVSSQRFQEARSLLESSESHLQVYGIQLVMQLLKEKDDYTLANGHVIIALALTTLKDKESYTFLNCVRLFVALVYVMEAEVLELLSDEFLNDNAKLDFRLVVGEAIIKVSQELGPFCYKYKQTLLNCFMQGARAPINEFRMSSFSNLAQLCRLLSYQVHQFFEELLNLINSEISFGQYLPTKRAAVLVLSELLQGMNNLLDFQEMLLPLYRILRDIESDVNCDEKMRIHASNGLKILNDKCKDMLFPQDRLEKEIKILNIKDDKPKSGLKKHILEMN